MFNFITSAAGQVKVELMIKVTIVFVCANLVVKIAWSVIQTVFTIAGFK